MVVVKTNEARQSVDSTAWNLEDQRASNRVLCVCGVVVLPKVDVTLQGVAPSASFDVGVVSEETLRNV